MPILDRLSSLVARVLHDLSTALLALVMLTVFMQVVFRYLLQMSVPWTEEAARYLNVWMVFLGCAAAASRDDHIRVAFLADRLRGVAHDLLDLATYLIMLAFDVIIVLGAAQLAQMNWNQEATTFPVSVGVLYLALVVASFFAALFLLRHIGRVLSSLFGGDA